MTSRKIINSKLKEAVDSVLPITLIVAVLCFFFVPVGSGLMLAFLVGAVMLILGMGLFTLGAELSMTQMGNLVGAKMTKSRRLWLILVLAFVLGVVITIAEPDLQVLAQNVPGIDKAMLILTVSVGVGIFLTICMLRILLGISLRTLLLIFYAIVFILAALSDPDFLSVAFDSGGVTTGPMTVPFIMALGVGVASIRSDEKAKSDSFGLVALCSIGPILAVLLLGFLYPENTASASETVVNSFENTLTVGYSYLEELPAMMGEVAIALLPICVFFLLFQIFSLHLRKLPLLRILIGVGYTYVGLVLFLTGVNVGFSSLGYVLGGVIVEEGLGLLMIPLATLMGWFIINAEPAVHVLNKQVEELSAGAISSKAYEPVHRRGRRHGTCHGARPDRHLHSVVRAAGLYHRAGSQLFRPQHLHRHRLRLRRRGFRPADRHLHAALCHGRYHGAGRQCDDRRLRPCGAGGHDAPDRGAGHGRHLRGQDPPQQCAGIRARIQQRGRYRTVGGGLTWNCTI